MDSRNDRPIFWLTASVACAALGAGLGWWLRGGAAQAASLSPAPVTGVTREEIEGLKRELLARLDELARIRATATPAAAGADGQVIELGRRIDELDARIALIDSKTPPKDGSSLWTPPKGPGSGSLEAIIERMQAWYGNERIRPPGDDIEEQLKKEHDLWTFEDVVRAYGPPRRWERDGKDWQLYYGSFPVSGWDEKQTVRFGLRDGFVAWLSIEECEP